MTVYSEQKFYYIPISDTPFELHAFWPFDRESRIKLTFSESVSLSLKTRLMTLLNLPQETFMLHCCFTSTVNI